MTPAAQPAAVRRPTDRHDHNQEEPVTTPEEITAIQAIRLNAVAAANTYLGAGLRSLANNDPHRLLTLAETITAYIADGTTPAPTCTCKQPEAGWPGSGETIPGNPRGCAIHDPALTPTDPEAMREAASRLLTAANEAEAGR